MKLYDFVMGDMFEIVQRVKQSALFIINFLREYKLPFSIVKVQLKSSEGIYEDITKDYINNCNWEDKYNGNYLVYVTWRYCNTEYKYVYEKENPIPFPPYTLEQLRQKVPKKIMALSVDKDDTLYDELKKYAGPMHNFYNDVCSKNMNIEWILNKPAENVQIIDSLGKFYQISAKQLSFT